MQASPIHVAIVLLSLASAALSACSPSNEAQSVERHVEDGVEVVVSHAPAWSPEQAWRLGDTPTLRIGDDESLGAGYLFSGIPGATRLSDGRVVIADRIAAELRFFDGEGTLLQVVGRRGQGPGELPWIFSLLRCGESSLHAVGPDVSISVVDVTGEFQRRFHPAEQAGVPIRPSFVCGRDGELVVTSRSPEPVGAEGLYRTAANILMLDLNGNESVVDLGSFSIQERLAGSGGSSSHPLGRQTFVAVSGGRIHVGTGDRYEITAYDRDGKPVRRIRRAIEPTPLDRAAVARYLERWVETVPPEDRALMLRRFSDAEHPDAYPAHARLLGDTRGYLWVESFPQERQSGTTWSVFDADGVWLGDVQMPAGLHALEIGNDYVLGRFTDELGQESVHVYALER